MSQVAIEVVALEAIAIDETAAGIVLCCPHCGNRSDDPDDAHNRTGARFQLLEDIVCFRRVRGVRRAGDGAPLLVVEPWYESGEGYDDGSAARVECGVCFGEFALPDSLEVSFE